MGLDIGVISINFLSCPEGRAYEFAWELAEEASVNGYMYGEGNSWGGFTQRQVLGALDDFARRKGLDDVDKAQVLAWVRSLPWDSWNDDIGLSAAPTSDSEDDYDPVLDQDPNRDGGLVELYFNW